MRGYNYDVIYLIFAFISHIHCLVAVCQSLIKLLLTYLLTYLSSIRRPFDCDQITANSMTYD